MNKKFFNILLLLTLCGVLNAQSKNVKLEKKNDNYYLVDNGRSFRVDPTVLIGKPKHNFKLNNSIKGTSISTTGYVKIIVPDSIEVSKYATYLEKTGDFDNIEYNCYYTPFLTANDPYYETQWYLNNINIQEAWNITTGSSSIKVAVIDNGVSGHTDLNDNIDANAGFDFVSNTSPAIIGEQHGTAVAGVISAKTNNSVGIAGIAGGYGTGGVKIIPYRTNYSTIQIATAVEAAILQGVKVINMSLGGAYSDLLSQSITHAVTSGITVVCASGNDNMPYISFPASHDYTIAVGASNIQNSRASFSNYGSGLDLVAPGVSVFTTDLNNMYESFSGTSLSCPQVAGVAALMLSVNPNLTPMEIKTHLISTCTEVPGYLYDNLGWNVEVGYGLLNAAAAVQAAENTLPHIIGPTIPCNHSEYSVTNWPVDDTVEWSIVSSDDNLTIEEIPQTIYGPEYDDNQCQVSKYGSYAKGTLTAQLKSGNTVIRTLTKIIDTGADFSGTWYQQGDSASTLTSGGTYLIQSGKTVYLQSDDFLGATVTYTSSMSPFSGVVHNNGVISFTPPRDNTFPEYPTIEALSTNAIHPINSSLTITVVKDGTCEAYRFKFIIRNSTPIIDPLLNVTNAGGKYTFSILPDVDTTTESTDACKDSTWQLEIICYDTGKTVYRNGTSASSLSVNTTDWNSGIYVATAVVNGKTTTKKFYIK